MLMGKILKNLPWWIAGACVLGFIWYVWLQAALETGSFVMFLVAAGALLVPIGVTIAYLIGRPEELFFPLLLIGIPLLLLIGDLLFDLDYSVNRILDEAAIFTLFFVIPVFLLVGLWVALKRAERGYKEDVVERAWLRRFQVYKYFFYPWMLFVYFWALLRFRAG